jgi:hypothetical protein
MFERGSGRDPLVLKDENIAKALVPSQVDDSLPVSPQNLLHPLDGQRRQRLLMERGFDHDLMSPNPIHLIVHPFSLSVQVSFNPEGRELVGNDPEAPTGRVGAGSIAAEGQDLRRSLVLVSFAEGTKSSGRLLLFNYEIRGPPAPFGRNDYPSSMNGIFSEFRHEEKSFGDPVDPLVNAQKERDYRWSFSLESPPGLCQGT